MTESEIVQFVAALAGVDVVVVSEQNGAPEVAWGDSFFSYDLDGTLPADRRFPFATIVTKDYEGFDTASDLNRPGVFRVNIWIGKAAMAELFPADAADDHDVTALDTPVPHPIYGAQGWVSILNPGAATSALTKRLLLDAHARAIERHERQERKAAD